MPRIYVTLPIEERFWPKVRGGAPDECWEWQASRTPGGYGRIGCGDRVGGWAAAHRVSWELHHGPIPSGLLVLHRCDNPPCVNPAHLFLGTHADNGADRDAKGRRNDARGERHASARLTVEQVREIRAQLGDVPKKELARRYGVRYQSIQAIASGKSWGWLT